MPGQFRDWPRTLKPASYRGAGFFVEDDDIETGRRLDIHEFPLADAPYVEDLGRKANLITVTGYVLSDQADAEEKRLRKACERGGAATLSLPIERLRAHCESCRRTFSKDRQGLIAFDMAFVRDGVTGGAFPVGFLASIVANSAAGSAAIFAAAFDDVYRALRAPGYVGDAASADIQAVAGLADSVLRSAPLANDQTPPLFAAAQKLYDAAPTLARAGASADTYVANAFMRTAEQSSGAALVGAIASLVAGIAAAAPDDVLGVLEPLIAYDADVAPAVESGWRLQTIVNRQAIAAVVRGAALLAFAKRVAETRYDDRRAAVQARADVAELFDFEFSRLTPWRDHAVADLLSSVAGQTAEYLTRLIADLAPIVIVDAPRTMPALYWAQRLYGDANRAEQLVKRNGVIHGGFMPLSFEALSR